MHQGSCPGLLLDMIQGWYLLCDAGMDTGERNMILASLKQDFSFHRVAQKLRNQWTDEDLRRRDQAGRHHIGWWIDDAGDEDGDVEDVFVSTEDLNEEGKTLMIAAQEAEHANGRCPARSAQFARSSLQAASRQDVQEVFQDHLQLGTRAMGRARPGLELPHACGGDHRTSKGPRTSTQANAATAEQSAPFVCYAEESPGDWQESRVVHGNGGKPS